MTSRFFYNKPIKNSRYSVCQSQIIANGITFLRATVLHHPTGAIVQFVIENIDKGGKWMYEHQKGKGFH